MAGVPAFFSIVLGSKCYAVFVFRIQVSVIDIRKWGASSTTSALGFVLECDKHLGRIHHVTLDCRKIVLDNGVRLFCLHLCVAFIPTNGVEADLVKV